MNLLARSSLLIVALLVSGFSFGFAPVQADELPVDTNKMERLTPEQARKLAMEFPGVEVEIEINGYGKHWVRACLPLNGLKSLSADTAKALAELKGFRLLCLNGLTALDADTAKVIAQFKGSVLHLNGLTTLDAEAAKALAANDKWTAELSAVTALDSPDSVAIAKALATRKGLLFLPNLKRISPKTLTALIEKRDVKIPLIETLELIQEPDGSPTEDFIIPKWLEERQEKQRLQQAAREAE